MTLTAKNELVNAAAAHLGEPGFDSVDVDPPGAKLAKFLAQLDGPAGVERWVLARHPWLCALTFASLSPAVRAGNWKWAKVFDLPDGFVKLHVVDGEGIAYQVGTETLVGGAIKHVIWSNEAALNVAYTEAKGFEAYSADLLNVMAFMLASRTAGPLKNDYDGAARLKKAADDALALAETGEAGEYVDPVELFTLNFARLRAAAG